MNPTLKFRDELGRVPFLVDELDSFSASISGVWGVEHDPSGSHTDIHADSLELDGDWLLYGTLSAFKLIDKSAVPLDRITVDRLTGIIELVGDVAVTDNVAIAGDTSVAGNVTIAGTLGLVGDMTFSGVISAGVLTPGNDFMYIKKAQIVIGCATTAANAIQVFENPNGLVGQINTDGVNTVYATVSDGDLKNVLEPTKSALARIGAIEVVDFEFKAEPGRVRVGVIAQQLHGVFPDAVIPGKDGVPWMVDNSKLVPLLVRAIQELAAELV